MSVFATPDVGAFLFFIFFFFKKRQINSVDKVLAFGYDFFSSYISVYVDWLNCGLDVVVHNTSDALSRNGILIYGVDEFSQCCQGEAESLHTEDLKPPLTKTSDKLCSCVEYVHSSRPGGIPGTMFI